jgi:23S rRNA pseudouridine2604 synthase
MATLKLKNKATGLDADSARTASPVVKRPPVRGTGNGVRPRPTLAAAQNQRDEREARYQEQLRLRYGEKPPEAPQRPRYGESSGPQQGPRRSPPRGAESASRRGLHAGQERGEPPSRGQRNEGFQRDDRAPRGRPDGPPTDRGPARSASRPSPTWEQPGADHRPRPNNAFGQRSTPSAQRPPDRGPAGRDERGTRPERDDRERRPPAYSNERNPRNDRTERNDRYPRSSQGEAPGRPAQRDVREARRPLPPARPVQQREPARGGPNEAFRGRPRAQERDDDFERPEPTSAPGSMRLSKYMGEMGIASRREADEWIEKGWVRVDGRVVSELGSRVMPGQQVTVDAQARFVQAQKVTVLINKPVGYVSGQAEDGYEPALVLVKPVNQWTEDKSGTRFLPQHLRSLVPAGRLDIDSVGLLVLTQDGRVAKQLIGETTTIEKEYLVRVASADERGLSDEGLALLRHGLELDEEPLLPALVEWVNEDQLRFVLREGKKRQIRRMCEAVGLQVLGLKRVRIGKVMLGDLPPGQWRYLRNDEGFV